MGTVAATTETIFDCEVGIRSLGADSMALVLSKQEFLAIDHFDDRYRYELIHGVVVVSPYPGPAERGPNGNLEHWLWSNHEANPGASTLDGTLGEQAIDTGICIRRADRVIWTGLGRQPVPMKDLPSIVVEFVSNRTRDRRRDYDEKRAEYASVGVAEYWVIDRFRRTMTVCRGHQVAQVVKHGEIYETTLLPGFRLSLGDLLLVADRWSAGDT
jgi:Uma2 family endonuclease